MFAFLYSMNAPLAIPVTGPAWLGRQVSWLVMLVMGLVIAAVPVRQGPRLACLACLPPALQAAC
jgi:hypothetical protein